MIYYVLIASNPRRMADGNIVTFADDDTAIDLGAIAKGYIADRIKDYLTEQGVKSAIINLGGNVVCVGEKTDGKPFKIGLQKPFADRTETVAALDINDLSVVSSGVYERHFIQDGVNYHHILDPHTGYPYENGLTQVTIISKLSVDGDGLSTSCFALGLENGMKLADSLDGVYAVFITEDGELHYSEGAQEFLSSDEGRITGRIGRVQSTQRSGIRWVKIFIERTDWGKEAYRRIF